MEFVGELVEHKTFGIGKISEFNDKYIVVKFENDVIKDFVYPNAFDTYLKLFNETLHEQVQDKLIFYRKKEAEKELKEIERKEEAHKLKLLKTEIENSKKISIKKVDSNIVFKCNYCDGGTDSSGLGYRSVCSDENINYNINIAKNKVCSAPECNCNQYLVGYISKPELENSNDENKNFCYERNLLNNWSSYPDISFTGENGAKVKKLKNVNQGSLVLLSTVLPNEKEKDRIIIGAYLLQDDYLFAYNTEGSLKAHPKYRVELSLDEAKRVKYWDYLYNTLNPKKIVNTSTTYRYFDDVQAAQVLKAIMDIKKDTPDETIAKEIYDDYCKDKNIKAEETVVPAT